MWKFEENLIPWQNLLNIVQLTEFLMKGKRFSFRYFRLGLGAVRTEIVGFTQRLKEDDKVLDN